ncbi:MAG: YjbH domain-containing protein [Bacteroides sp.]|nr:YjbH domain-containing protein [Bacteroides sp.]
MKRKVVLTVLLLCISMVGYTQVLEKLKTIGFENIQIAENDTIVTIALEDNIYRGTYRGIGKAIEASLEGMQKGTLEMVILDNRVPQLCITLREELITAYQQKEISIREVYAQMEMTVSTDEAIGKLKEVEIINTSQWKTDIILYPEVSLENFSMDKLYHYKVNFAPAIQTSPWKGAMITAQIIFPIATNIKGEATRIRPGIITLSQDIRLKKNFLGRVVVGNFTDNQIGIQAGLRYRSPNGRIEAMGLIGTTGYSEITRDEGWYIGFHQEVTGMLKGIYYEPCLNVELSAQVNRYLFGDYGIRGDLTRHFGEYAIGLYAIAVKGRVNGGFHFAIPFRGKSCKRNHKVRIKLPDYYAAEYSREPRGRYMDEKMGTTYDTRPDENRSIRFYQPDYIRHFLIRELQ